jgi:hypothetical protein
MKRIIMVLAVAALMAAMLVAMAAPAMAAGPPTGGCPTSNSPGLVPVDTVLQGAGLSEPDPSMDRNADNQTCLKILDTGSGTRATWHDNTL